jgi:hypothetical protein
MREMTTTPVVRADFNNVYDDAFINVSVRRHPDLTVAERLAPGDVVELVDEAGESCLAWVQERRGVVLVCKIDWGSWRSMSEDNHIDGSFELVDRFTTASPPLREAS